MNYYEKKRERNRQREKKENNPNFVAFRKVVSNRWYRNNKEWLKEQLNKTKLETKLLEDPIWVENLIDKLLDE